jgi:transcriptional regulator with XRE-family HTH domain
MMATSYRLLREKMSLEAQARAEEKAEIMIREMALVELRGARAKSQEELAAILGMKQSSVSKLERRTDMYISSLRKFIEAMGGTLEIMARFPEGDVKINQFEDLEADAHS